MTRVNKQVIGQIGDNITTRSPEQGRLDQLRTQYTTVGTAQQAIHTELRHAEQLIVQANRNPADNLLKASQHIQQAKDILASRSLTYTVKPGDTLSGIAKETLGDASRYMEIANANKEAWTSMGKKFDVDLIFPGMVFQVPVTQATYTVKRGDNLWNIAKETLGAGNRYMEIANANKDAWAKAGIAFNPDNIRPGMVFQIGQPTELLEEQEEIEAAQHAILAAAQKDYNDAFDHDGPVSGFFDHLANFFDAIGL